MVPPAISTGGRGWWVSTKTGWWYGGSAPHQPVQDPSGHGPRTGQTPAEFALSLKRSVRQAKDVTMLAAAYNRSRFGKREPEEEKAILAEMWSPLRNALLGSIVRRITRRGRTLNEDR